MHRVDENGMLLIDLYKAKNNSDKGKLILHKIAEMRLDIGTEERILEN